MLETLEKPAFSRPRDWIKAGVLVILGHCALGLPGLAVHYWSVPEPTDYGAQNVVEMVDFTDEADSQEAKAAPEIKAQDSAATKAVQEVKSSEVKTHDLQEQAAPEEAKEDDLRLAQQKTEKTQTEPVKNVQTTEAAAAQQQVVSSQAQEASEAKNKNPDATQDQAVADREGVSKDQGANILAWQREIFKHITHYKFYPEAGYKTRMQGVATVEFFVNEAGDVSQVRIATSSGYAVLNDAALETMKRAGRLPKPPQVYSKGIRLALPLQFRVPR